MATPVADELRRRDGVQFGVQSEPHSAEPRATMPPCLLGSPPSRAPRELLGAGRSQVQILSPRLAESPDETGLLCVSDALSCAGGVHVVAGAVGCPAALHRLTARD